MLFLQRSRVNVCFEFCEEGDKFKGQGLYADGFMEVNANHLADISIIISL